MSLLNTMTNARDARSFGKCMPHPLVSTGNHFYRRISIGNASALIKENLRHIYGDISTVPTPELSALRFLHLPLFAKLAQLKNLHQRQANSDTHSTVSFKQAWRMKVFIERVFQGLEDDEKNVQYRCVYSSVDTFSGGIMSNFELMHIIIAKHTMRHRMHIQCFQIHLYVWCTQSKSAHRPKMELEKDCPNCLSWNLAKSFES